MRLIDADALFEVIKKSMAENPHKEETQKAMHIHEHKYFLTLLTTFPTIQLEERTDKRTETHARDLISRQAAIDAAELAYVRGMFPTPFIREVPPAQPERKTGRWIDTQPNYKSGYGSNAHYCSVCKGYYTTSPSEMHFCPNCGADMRGVQE